MDNPNRHLTFSPSFGDADREISTVEFSHPGSDDEFQFSVNPGALTAVHPADEIFCNGWIHPIYPVFSRGIHESDLNPTEFRSGSTSSEDSIGNYCTWTPRSVPQSPDRASREGGSGSGSKKWRMRDLIGGRRSQSDGKDKFGFLMHSGSGTKGGKDPKEMDMVTAHKLFYGKGKGEKKDGKRSFLPYRTELVGLFANSRPHHSRPFNL